MYGLIIENVLGYLRSHFHAKRYEEIVRLSKLPFDGAPDIERVYPEGIVAKLGKKAVQVLQVRLWDTLDLSIGQSIHDEKCRSARRRSSRASACTSSP